MEVGYTEGVKKGKESEKEGGREGERGREKDRKRETTMLGFVMILDYSYPPDCVSVPPQSHSFIHSFI